MRIRGKCHCGNIGFELEFPGAAEDLAVRACGCTFCVKHGGVCASCGAVPFVTSEIESRLYAVVNVNSFEGIDPASLVKSAADFEGESTDSRLARRRQRWIPEVSIT